MYPLPIPKSWGRMLVAGSACPAWKFQVLDANRQPIQEYEAEFVMKRTASDKTALMTWKTSDETLKKVGVVSTFTGFIPIEPGDVVIGGWFKIGNGEKIPVLCDRFKIILNTTPNA